MGRWVHPASLGLLGFAPCVVEFIPGRWILSSSRWGSLGSSGVVGFTSVGAGVVGFIRDRWILSGVRWVHPGS